jgi:undecaprenyl-diphosphatase
LPIGRASPTPDAAPSRRRLHLAWLFLAADLLAFALLTALVADDGSLGAWDRAANAAFAPYRHGIALTCFLWVTALGTGAALLGVTAAMTILLAAFRRAALVPAVWLVFLGTEVTTWAVKFALARPRPVFIPEASALSPSFPSAHTALSAAVYGFLAYLAAREAERRHPRIAVAAFATLTVGVIGFSRIFLSVHYVTDVVGGVLIAGFWLVLGALAAGRAERSRAAGR